MQGNPDHAPDEVISDARGDLLLRGELLVRRGGRVYDQRLGVAHVGQVRGQLDAVDEGDACVVRVGGSGSGGLQHRLGKCRETVIARPWILSSTFNHV